MSPPARRAVLLYVLAAFVLAPFGPASCNRSRTSLKPPPPPKTIVRVSNGDYLDAVIYVVHQGHSVRLGTATSNTTTIFVIPSQLIFGSTPLSFVIDPIGSPRRQSSGQVVVDPGDDLELQLTGGRVMIGKRPS